MTTNFTVLNNNKSSCHHPFHFRVSDFSSEREKNKEGNNEILRVEFDF